MKAGCIGLALGLLLLPPAYAGDRRVGELLTADLAPHTLLVADSQMGDPRFAHAVILLVDYSDRGAWGVVLNKPSHQKLAEVLEEPGAFSERDDRLFWGGPVGPAKPFILIKTSIRPSPRAKDVGGGLFMSGSAKLLAELAQESDDSRPFRVFRGYAGWGIGQLDREHQNGDWHVVPLTVVPLLETDPSHLWQDLIAFKNLKLVRLGEGDRQHITESFQ